MSTPERAYIVWDDELEEGYTTEPHRPIGQKPYAMLSEHTHRRICQMIKAGNYHQTAAQACGISARTLQKWLMRGTPDTAYWRSTGPWGIDEDPDVVPALMGLYCRFRRDVERASAEAEALHVAYLTRAAQDGEWKASVEWLRRGPAKSRWRDDIAVSQTTSATVHHRHELDLGRVKEIARGMQEAGLLDDEEQVIDVEASDVGELEP